MSKGGREREWEGKRKYLEIKELGYEGQEREDDKARGRWRKEPGRREKRIRHERGS